MSTRNPTISRLHKTTSGKKPERTLDGFRDVNRAATAYLMKNEPGCAERTKAIHDRLRKK